MDLLSAEGWVAVETAVAALAATVAAWLTWRIARESRETTYTMSRAKIVGKITWHKRTGDACLVLTNYGGMASNLVLGTILPTNDNPFTLYDRSDVARHGIPYLGDHEEIRILIGRGIDAEDLDRWGDPGPGTPSVAAGERYPYKLRIDYRDWLSKQDLHETIDLRLDHTFDEAG
jgi:hypothetical protein